MKTSNNSSNIIIKFFCIVFLVLIGIVAVRAGYIAIFKHVNGIDLMEFSSARGTVKETLPANRGTIFDRYGHKLAQNLNEYQVIAVLSPEYSKADPEHPIHVADPQATAEKLGPVIGMPVDELADRLNERSRTPGVWQVELGNYGKGLSQTKKEEIQALNLPGIEFKTTQHRQYPQGVFASHTLGYATYDTEADRIVGKMGVELTMDEEVLSGTPGSREYQENNLGQQITTAPEIKVPPVNGKDVYLTLDLSIQNFVEENMKKVQAEYNPKWIQVVVADPKTGKILAMGSTPSFNPETREGIAENYQNAPLDYSVEVGSVMKPLTYAAAIDANEGFNGDDIVPVTGQIEVDGFKINDWNRVGWTSLSYDDGICQSSNTAIASVVSTKMKPETYTKYLEAFGLTQPTGLGVVTGSEATGKIVYSTQAERITTGFGQGTTTTAVEMVQAYTAIANKGNMMQLQLVDKIIDPDTGELIYQSAPQVVGNPISEDTAAHVLRLMEKTVNDTSCSSGGAYAQDGFVLAGKTGTAEVPDPIYGGYYNSGDSGYNYSFVGIAPYDDPQYLIYATIALPQNNPKLAMRNLVNPITENSMKYLMAKNSTHATNFNTGSGNLAAIDAFPSFLNQVVADVRPELEAQKINAVIIGGGDTIIRQSHTPYTEYYSNEKVFFVTNGTDMKMPNMWGWSRADVEAFAKITGLKITIEGSGFVRESSKNEGDGFEAGNEITVKLGT